MKSFKKAQIKTLVEDLDSLLKSKGEIEKKSDFVFEKVKEIQNEVHQKMAKISEEFKLTKDPIINKVNDINQIAELYHQEINRTQIINREMLILTKVHHPNIIQLYEIIETRRYYFFVMEYAKRGE